MHGDDDIHDAEDVQPSDDDDDGEDEYMDENGVQMMQQARLLGVADRGSRRRGRRGDGSDTYTADPPFWPAGKLPFAVCAILALAPLLTFITFLVLVRFGVISLDTDIGVEQETREPDTSFIDELHPPKASP